MSSGPLEAGSGQNECSPVTHLALDPLISAARSRLSPSLSEAQSFLPRWAGTPCVKHLQAWDRANASPCIRDPLWSRKDLWVSDLTAWIAQDNPIDS